MKPIRLLPGLLAILPAAPAAPALMESADDPPAKLNVFRAESTLACGRYYFAERIYGRYEKYPDWLDGFLFFESSVSQSLSYRCLREGTVIALVPVNKNVNHARRMEALGFREAGRAPFLLFKAGAKKTDTSNGYAAYEKQLGVGEMISLPAWTILTGFDVPRAAPTGAGGVLYNGIQLPNVWPPKIDCETEKPPPLVPWLKDRPAVVPIDVGRQLFVDDFLIEKTTLVREFHHPEKYKGNPVLKPETEIEYSKVDRPPGQRPRITRRGATITTSGGMWWNPDKQLFELWYQAGWQTTAAYATSRDGVHWERPSLPLYPGTNQVLPKDKSLDLLSIVLDPFCADPNKKFKIFMTPQVDMVKTRWRARYFTSPDGIDWGEQRTGGIAGDCSTMFYNPFRKKWVYSLRWSYPADRPDGFRARAYWEDSDFERGMNWVPDQPVPWARADRLDRPDSRIGDTPQLYNLDAVAYESIMLGAFKILHGPRNDIAQQRNIPKFTGINFAYSRDGFHWHRPDRRLAIKYSYSAGAWDRGYLNPLGNICVVRGEKLWFYYTGFSGREAIAPGDDGDDLKRTDMHAGGATGAAILRRDGFASMNAGRKGGVLLTRPVRFSGTRLFVNAAGTLVAEVCDEAGKPVAPFTFDNCEPFSGDSTISAIRWKEGADLSAHAGKNLRFHFRLDAGGKLYAFWVSHDETGRSDGFLAGGGPGYTGLIDTVGLAALRPAAAREN
ncbi:MAG: hypothetical protein LBC18_03960 [Opitutaceae bacterium]|nr:hypothetical protein [Opitutaceae bacterium]